MLTANLSTAMANYGISIIIAIGSGVSSFSLWNLDQIPIIPLLLCLYPQEVSGTIIFNLLLSSMV